LTISDHDIALQTAGWLDRSTPQRADIKDDDLEKK